MHRLQHRRSATAVGLGTALLVVVAIAGCAAKTTGGTSASQPHPNSGSIAHPSGSSSPTPAGPAAGATPTPSGPAPLPANALFRITATVTAGNGAIADLVQTVYNPIAPDAADTTLLNKQCNYPGQPDFQGQPTWQSQVPNPLYLTSDLTATLRPGSPAFNNSADFVLFSMPGAPGAYSGQYGIFEAYCDSGYIQVPGSVHGVAAILSTDPVHGQYSWAGPTAYPTGYGFSGGGNDPGAPDLGGSAVVTNCSVQVSAAAIAAVPALGAWKTAAPDFELGCTYIT